MTHHRKIEFLLLLAVQIVLLAGLSLVYLGKQASSNYPAQPFNINTASAGEYGAVLSVSKEAAAQLVTERDTHRGKAWASVSGLRHANALKGITTSPIDQRFIARTASEVARAFWGGTAVFLLVFWLAHAILRKSAPTADPFLLPFATLLSGLGLIMVTSVKDPYRDTFVFGSQVWGVALYGILALLVPLTRPFGRLPLRRYRYAYAGSAVFLMLLLLVFGHGPGGIHIQMFGFEPIEIIKLLLVLFVASYLAEQRGKVSRLADFGPLALVYTFCLGLFLLVKDLGPAVLLFGVFLALLYLTTRRLMYPLVGSALLLLAASLGYALHFGFFATRVVMWLHPWDNADKNGAQLAQGLWGMATGGLWGSGLGLGGPEFVPRAGSDSVFATLGEQLGLVGGLVVLAVYALVIARGMRIARRAVTEFDRLLAAGLTLLLGLQTMIILGGVTGLTPLTGITLPFVSFGASSLVADFFAVGLLLHLSGKTLPASVADRAAPEWTRAARTLVVGCAAYLLVGVGVLRLVSVQGIQDQMLATRILKTPDRDTVPGQPLPAHVNPRLLTYADTIERGAIVDRNGSPLAENPTSEDAPGQTTLLCPDGRRRFYPGGPACAQLVAAVERPAGSSNALGQNARLRGFESYAALLSPYRDRHLPWHKDPHGEEVTLSVDVHLQQAALDALHKYASAVRDRRTGRPKNKGAAVLLNAKTGEVLALVSLPTFDPAALTPESWEAILAEANGPAFNRALYGLYPPGSAFKIVTASAGMTFGHEQYRIDCRHSETNVVWRTQNGHRYSRRHLTDEEGFVPHGDTDMAKALRVSCNLYFAHLGIVLGADHLNRTARQQYGLAHMPSLEKIGADLPDCAYGQGAVTLTPLEMGRVVLAVANEGELLPTTLLKIGKAPPGTPALTSAQAGRLRKMLAGVVTDGTARGVFDGLPVSVAGKTGSAQTGQGDGMTHSWFAGFAPAENPTLAFACVVENGGAGRAAAAPVCREMVRAAIAR